MIFIFIQLSRVGVFLRPALRKLQAKLPTVFHQTHFVHLIIFIASIRIHVCDFLCSCYLIRVSVISAPPSNIKHFPNHEMKKTDALEKALGRTPGLGAKTSKRFQEEK